MGRRSRLERITQRTFNCRVNALKKALEDRGIDFELKEREISERLKSGYPGNFAFLININGLEYTIFLIKGNQAESVSFYKVIDSFEFNNLAQLLEIMPYFNAAMDIAERYNIHVRDEVDHTSPNYPWSLRYEWSKKYSLLLTTHCPPMKNLGNLVDAVLEYDKRRKMIEEGV